MVLSVKLTESIHNFENNPFWKQLCSDNGKRSYFTAFFCNNTNIYSSQSTVRSTIVIAAAALASLSDLFAHIVLLLLSSSSANYSCFSQWFFSIFHFQKKCFDNGKIFTVLRVIVIFVLLYSATINKNCKVDNSCCCCIGDVIQFVCLHCLSCVVAAFVDVVNVNHYFCFSSGHSLQRYKNKNENSV